MSSKEFNNKYFNWMCQLVLEKLSYQKLLDMLHNIEFTYIIAMDGNRFEDGIDLRYRFGYENEYPESVIAKYLDNRPCSVLEMMIALSIRLEEHIMDDPDIGDRTDKWFWGMIANLGLGSMDDSTFEPDYSENCVQKFLNRDYQRNGKGGLFTLEHCREDLRTVEIWYQACWYLEKIIQEGL